MLGYQIAPNIEVIPVLRYRLSFAHRIARYILSARAGTIVAADLPRFLEDHQWLSIALDGLPKTSNILVRQPKAIYACPVVPNDPPWLALWTARKHGFEYHCVDDAIPSPLPDIEISLQDDVALDRITHYLLPKVLPVSVDDLAGRAARILARVQPMAARASVIMVCDWRLAMALLQAGDANVHQYREPEQVPTTAAILAEDPLLLWQCGYLDDIPAITARSLELLDRESLGKVDSLRLSARKIRSRFLLRRPTTLHPAQRLLEPALQELTDQHQTRMAELLLSYPEWSLTDLSGGLFPSFSGLRDGRLDNPYTAFEPPDVFESVPFYSPSTAEKAFFTPSEELSLRRFWGSLPAPPITRTEAAVNPTDQETWTVPASFVAMAEGARLMRENAKLLEPGVECNLFTPASWWFRGDSDGDHRSVQDANLAYRREQLREMPEIAVTISDDGTKPDVFHTLAATRVLHARLALGVNQDIACSISLLYTGPESGPDRYRAVARHGLTPRVDPASEFTDLRLDERPLAFAIANTRERTVLLAHAREYSPSRQILDLAEQKHVRIIAMPLGILPPALQRSIQRRIFMSENMRWSKYGDRIAERAVNWRVPPDVRQGPRRRIRDMLRGIPP